MAFRNRLRCFICDRVYVPNQMARMDGDNNQNKQDIAIRRREARNMPSEEITDVTRLCINCNQSIRLELERIEEDPRCTRLNVLTVNHYRTCVFCNSDVNIHRLSRESRIDIFVNVNIYVPAYVRFCEQHLDDKGFVFRPLQDGLQFINRPIIIEGQELNLIFQQMRSCILRRKRFDDFDSLTEEEFSTISPITREQLNELYTFSRPVPRNDYHGFRYITKRDLIMFLCKMKHGLSDEFLKVMFQYTSRQAVSLVVETVRKSLMLFFVPQNIRFDAITPAQYINEHVTEFANALYNPNPENPRVIVCVDGTYSYITKNSNYRALRQSFCVHKGRHLVKPVLLVAPDGYILAIQGPYFSDSRNNDAALLRNEFERDNDRMSEWFQEGSIMIVDRAYRDATQILDNRGILWRMPALLEPQQRQLTTEQANESRLVTKSRWVVEVRNGHIKTMFQLLAHTINVSHVHHLNDFYKIAGAIINRYHPRILMEGANAQLAERMIAKAREANVVQAVVEIEMLHTRNAQRWFPLSAAVLPDFPALTLQFLRDITFGVYQVRLAPSYVQDKMQRENNEGFWLEVQNPRNPNAIPGLIRIKIGSRFRNNARHQLWIAYRSQEKPALPENNVEDLILGYYCTCKSGARTLGTCAHVATVLWFLGYARIERNIRYPSTRIFQTIMDAGNRPHPLDPNDLVQRREEPH